MVDPIPELFSEPVQKDPRPSPKHSSRTTLLLVAVVVLVVAVGGLLITKHHPSVAETADRNTPAAPKPPPMTSPVTALSSSWEQYTLTFISGAQQIDTEFLATTQEMQHQSDRISSDSTQYSSDLAATSCSATSSDYISCVSQSEQAATQVQADENAADSAIQQDFQTIDAQASQLLGICHTYISQMGTLPWASALLKPAATLGAAVTQWGNDWQQIGTINSANASALAPLVTSTLAQDKATMESDMIVLAGMLGVTNSTITGIH